MKLRRGILSVAGALIVLSLLFPPWMLNYRDGRSKSQGYGFILSGPSVEGSAKFSRPDLERLALQIGAIALSAAVLLLLVGPRDQTPGRPKSDLRQEPESQPANPRRKRYGPWVGIVLGIGALAAVAAWLATDGISLIASSENPQPGTSRPLDLTGLKPVDGTGPDTDQPDWSRYGEPVTPASD